LRIRKFHVLGETVSAVVSTGTRRPVIFLHGNSSASAVWANQLSAVRRERRGVLAPDLPGHGRSDDSFAPERTYSLPGYSAVISALLDVLQWDDVDVVGWSLGGHIALQLLATDRRVKSLLIVGTPPAPLSAASLCAAFYASPDMDLASKSHFDLDDAQAYGSAMMGGEAHLTPELLRWIRRTDSCARSYFFASALRGVGRDQKEVVETISNPLCVVHGEKDAFVRLNYLRSLRYRALWQNKIFVVANAGHAPHFQLPSVFNSILLKFLAFTENHQKTRTSILQTGEPVTHNCAGTWGGMPCGGSRITSNVVDARRALPNSAPYTRKSSGPRATRIRY
jgi:pimeloyl-ACP methyl ester carboxylesterase